jgi:hypothetical protein
LVRGERSARLDTCRVRYRIENRSDRKQTVGIRFLLDSFIGSNDGVPFTIPGDPNLCDTLRELMTKTTSIGGMGFAAQMPDFIQALEKPDLGKPGTIAHVRLKLNKTEPPCRVTLGAWPSERLRVLDRRAQGLLTLWEVPLLSMKTLDLNDSAIVIYWSEQTLEPDASREVGFEYGLWELATQSSELATTLDGVFRPGGELTVVAYVKRSSQDGEETVTLELPPGFDLIGGSSTQSVPRPAGDAANRSQPVTWKVRAGATGQYQLTVKTSTGLSQKLSLEIKSPIFD